MTGDIVAAERDALVNTVNCVGIMGRGIALQFKKAFPGNFKAYAAACERGDVTPGRLFVYERGELTPPRYIINFPTKVHWREQSRLEYIEAGLEDLVRVVRSYQIRSIAIPPLGSGLGGLPWEAVRPLIERAVDDLAEVDVDVYEPVMSRRQPASPAAKPLKMTPGRAALVGLTRRYLDAVMDPGITLLEVHKLMYFLQAAGEPLRLKYKKAWYGPYAENLRHVVRDVEGYLLIRHGDEADAPNVRIELLPAGAEQAEALLRANPSTRQRMDDVSRLVEGYESAFGLELLTSVHWIMTHESRAALHDVERSLQQWGWRKRRFTDAQIKEAYDRILAQSWADRRIRV